MIAGTHVGGRHQANVHPSEGSLHRLHWVPLRKIEGRARDLRKSPLVLWAWRRRRGKGLGPRIVGVFYHRRRDRFTVKACL